MSKKDNSTYVVRNEGAGYDVGEIKHNDMLNPLSNIPSNKLDKKNSDEIAMAQHQATLKAIDIELKKISKNKYAPDFSLSDEYLELSKQLSNMNLSQKDRDDISKKMLFIKIQGNVSPEFIEDEKERVMTLPIASVIKKIKSLEIDIEKTKQDIDNFDYEYVQRKLDEVSTKYQGFTKGMDLLSAGLTYQKDFNNEADKIEFELMHKPLNDLKLKLYYARTIKTIYDLRLKYYVQANKDLIKLEIEEAKRREIKGSLLDLAPYVEEV